MPENVKMHDPSRSSGNGMTKLKSSSSPAQSLLVIAFCALVWNSTSILLYKYQRDTYDREWAIILLGLYIIVNAAFLIAFCYFMVLYFIGQPKLKISSTSPMLGEKVAITWELPDYRSASRLSIILEGLESMDGKNCTFTSIKVADTTENQDIKSGSAEFKIPGNSMHSFDDSRFQIIWQLKLHAEKEWKDRRIKYIINVQPYEV